MQLALVLALSGLSLGACGSRQDNGDSDGRPPPPALADTTSGVVSAPTTTGDTTADSGAQPDADPAPPRAAASPDETPADETPEASSSTSELRVSASAGGERLTVDVSLHPHLSVVGKKATRVSFGLPLPPGVLDKDSRVQVLAGGEEIPAHVSAIGKWRSMPPAALRCKGVPTGKKPGIRSLLIQFDRSFSGRSPETIQVVIGASRSKNLAKKVDVRKTWRLVDEGSYDRSFEIHEPAVYAVLPPTWLSCAGLATALSVSGVHSDLTAFDKGQYDFFHTVLNSEKANPKGIIAKEVVNYQGHFEPWLYDRAQTFYNGYIRTGKLEFLREAHRATQHYMQNLYTSRDCRGRWKCAGFFKLKNNNPGASWMDSKYSYNESMATLHWLTGDPRPLEHLSDATQATSRDLDVTRVIDGMGQAFTERHAANGLLTPLMEYEVTGSRKALKRVQRGLDALHKNQTSPFPRGSKNPVNGCWNHDLERTGRIGIGPWKMSLLAHALLRVYFTTGDKRIPKMVVAAAKCFKERALYTASYRNGRLEHIVVREEAISFGKPESADGDQWTDLEHAIDGAFLTGVGYYFATNRADKKSLLTSTRELLATHEYALGNWTRPSEWPGNRRALHRVAPPRKYAWWYKNTGAIGWFLHGPTTLGR